jgi:hypothetical protein
MHSSTLRRIWLNLMPLFSFFGSFTDFNIFWISNFLGLKSQKRLFLVEMRMWCIKVGIVLVLHPYNLNLL